MRKSSWSPLLTSSPASSSPGSSCTINTSAQRRRRPRPAVETAAAAETAALDVDMQAEAEVEAEAARDVGVGLRCVECLWLAFETTTHRVTAASGEVTYRIARTATDDLPAGQLSRPVACLACTPAPRE
jgi:hypothetical protein